MTTWERRCWILALLFYGIGDTVTTLVGLSTGGAAEIGPLAGPAMEHYGSAGLLGIKIVIFGLFWFVWTVIDSPGRAAVPLALALVGVAVTIWNSLVIITAM